MHKLIVIYYHIIVDKGTGDSYQRIEKDKFVDQMQYLASHGYNTILLNELGEDIPDNSILISFDDGFRSVYEIAFPIMKEKKLKGNVFLATKYVNERDYRYIDFDMAKRMKQSGLFDFGGHTHTHCDIRALDKSLLQKEIKQSNSLFRDQLGFIPDAFCMPYGKFNKKNIAMLRELGYTFLFDSFDGISNSNLIKTHTIHRLGISNDDDMDIFIKKIEGDYNWKGAIQKGRLLVENIRGKRVTSYSR